MRLTHAIRRNSACRSGNEWSPDVSGYLYLGISIYPTMHLVMLVSSSQIDSAYTTVLRLSRFAESAPSLTSAHSGY